MSFSAHRIVIKTHKEDSALIYHLLEAHEGLAAYSTLDSPQGDPFRELELWVTDSCLSDVLALLEEWTQEGVVLATAVGAP